MSDTAGTDGSIGFRWLGVAGVELTLAGEVLAIDPYFTRTPLRRLWPGRVRPNARLSAEKLPRCDAVLVSHPHFDHLMDVPDVVRNTGATALGSDHTCRLLAAVGIPPVRIRRITAGDRFTLGRFEVEVLAAQHMRLRGRVPYAGPLPAKLRASLRPGDYRLDCCLSFLIQAQGRRLFFCAGEPVAVAPRADVLFVGPYRAGDALARLLADVQPQTVVPVHWDDLFRPLGRPVRPLRLPSLRRLDLDALRRRIADAAPGAAVLVPEMFRAYDIV